MVGNSGGCGGDVAGNGVGRGVTVAEVASTEDVGGVGGGGVGGGVDGGGGVGGGTAWRWRRARARVAPPDPIARIVPFPSFPLARRVS